MLRALNILAVAVMIAAAAIAYSISYSTERLQHEARKVERETQRERELKESLRAEWSVLEQPSRVQDLAEHYKAYLDLDRLDPLQIGTIEEIPLRAPKPAVPTDERQAGGPGAPAVTGSVRKPDPKTGATPAKPGEKPVEARTLEPRADDPLSKLIKREGAR